MITSICNPVHVHVEQIPPFVLNLAKFSVPFSAPISSMSNNSVSYSYKDDIMMHAKISDLPNCIQQSLVKHQRKAVLKCLQRNGRIILNDDLGLGKRLVAISSAIAYKPEWPLLNVCPAIFLQRWREEFVKWIPNFDLSKIQIIKGDADEKFRPGAVITIVAYQTLLQGNLL